MKGIVKAQIITQDAVIKLSDVKEALLYLEDLLTRTDEGYGLSWILRQMHINLTEVFSELSLITEENVKKYLENEEG